MSAVIASRRRAASMALLFLKRTAVSAIEPAGMACRTRFAVSGTRRRCWAGVLPQCQPRWSSVDHLDHHHHELPNRQTAKGLGYSCVSTACEAYGIRTGTSTGRPLGSSSYCTGTCRLSICSWLVRSLRRDRTNDLAWHFPDRSGCWSCRLVAGCRLPGVCAAVTPREWPPWVSAAVWWSQGPVLKSALAAGAPLRPIGQPHQVKIFIRPLINLEAASSRSPLCSATVRAFLWLLWLSGCSGDAIQYIYGGAHSHVDKSDAHTSTGLAHTHTHFAASKPCPSSAKTSPGIGQDAAAQPTDCTTTPRLSPGLLSPWLAALKSRTSGLTVAA